MRLRSFTAPNMPAAIEMVRAALGEEAVILSTEQLSGKSVKVTAAISLEEEEEKPAFEIKSSGGKAAETLRHEIQTMLRFHNVPEALIVAIMQKATGALLNASIAMHRIGGHKDPQHLYRLSFEKMLSDYFVFEPLAFTSGNKALMLVGPPGIGKTLTIAKIAAKLAMGKKPLCVITCDHKRAGGIEQLQAFTDILGIELKNAANADALYEHLGAAPRGARILIDTAGCNPYDDAQLEELENFASIDVLEPVLVLPAGGDSQESIDMVEKFAQLPIKKLLVTRADTARRFGGILSAAASAGLAFCNASSSPGVADPLEPIDAGALAQLLLRYQARTQDTRMKMEAYD